MNRFILFIVFLFFLVNATLFAKLDTLVFNNNAKIIKKLDSNSQKIGEQLFQESTIAYYQDKLSFLCHKLDNDSVTLSQFKIQFLAANNSLIKSEFTNESSNYQMFADSNSNIWFKKINSFKYFKYKNLYDGINFYLSCENSNLKFNLDCFPNSNYNNVKFKFEGVDSLKILSDSNLSVFRKNNVIIIPKLIAYQLDSNFNRIAIQANYQINLDTLNFVCANYDTNKTLYFKSEFANNTDTLIYQLSSGIYDEKLIDVLSLENGKDLILNSKQDFIFYNSLNENDFTSDLKIASNTFYKYELNTYENLNQVNSQLISWNYDISQINFSGIKKSNKNIILWGNVNNKLIGNFDSTLSTSKYFSFKPNKSNGVISLIDENGNLFNSKYINLDSNNSDLHLTNVLYQSNYFYFFANVDNLSNKNIFDYPFSYTNDTNASAYSLIIKYNPYRDLITNTMAISSKSTNDSLVFNDAVFSSSDPNSFDFYISGISNVVNLLDSAKWIKNNSTYDNFIIHTNKNLDTIYKSFVLEGNNSEYFNNESILKSKSKLAIINKEQFLLSGVSNSSSFNNPSPYISNSKNFNNFDGFIAKIDSMKKISRLLFLNNNTNSIFSDIKFVGDSILLSIQSKSNNINKARVYNGFSKDTMSQDTNFIKSIVYQIDNNLSLKNINNQIEFDPIFATYLESNNADLTNCKFMDVNNNYFSIVANLKSNNILNNNLFNKINSNTSTNYFDYLMLRVVKND